MIQIIGAGNDDAWPPFVAHSPPDRRSVVTSALCQVADGPRMRACLRVQPPPIEYICVRRDQSRRAGPPGRHRPLHPPSRSAGLLSCQPADRGARVAADRGSRRPRAAPQIV